MPIVAVPVLPGGPVFEVAVACEVFGVPRPDLFDEAYDLRLCRVQDGETRTGAGLVLDTRFDLDDVASADTVVVPALRTHDAEAPLALLTALRVAAARGARIASICTGAFVLAAAGLLNGRRATTHWMYAAELRRRFPDVEVDADVLYTVDGPIATSAGTAAGLDLCIELIRRDHGTAVANELARRLVVPPHRDGGQAQFVASPVAPDRLGTIAPVLDWARSQLHRPLTLGEFARAAQTSPRTLTRRFTATVGIPPMQWLVSERIRLAQDLLERSDLSIEQIADRCGLGSAGNLRAHFVQLVGTTPRTYRRTFGAAEQQTSTVYQQ